MPLMPVLRPPSCRQQGLGCAPTTAAPSWPKSAANKALAKKIGKSLMKQHSSISLYISRTEIVDFYNPQRAAIRRSGLRLNAQHIPNKRALLVPQRLSRVQLRRPTPACGNNPNTSPTPNDTLNAHRDRQCGEIGIANSSVKNRTLTLESPLQSKSPPPRPPN